MLHLPAQDVLEIQTADGERLVPFVAALVPEIDLDAGTLRSWPTCPACSPRGRSE